LRNALALEAKHGVLESDVLAEAAALAGELAHKAGDLGEADELYEQAIDASGEHNSIWIAEQMRARALTLEAMGEVERSGQLIHEAHRLLGGELSGEALVLSLGLERYAAWLRYRAGDLQGAADDFDDLLSRVDDEEPILRGLVLNGRGVAAYGLGHYGDAEAFFQRAMARFEKAGSPARLCSAYNNLGMLAAKQGDARLATSWYEKAMRIHAKAGNRTGLAHTYNNLGSLYGELGDYQRSEGFLRESIRIRERSGHASVALGYANLGEVLLKRGEFDEAMAHLQRAIHLCQKGSGPAYLLPDAWRTLAEIRLAKGDLDAARDACNEAINLAEAGKDLPRMAAAYRVRGSVADADGQPDDAVAHIERAITYLEHIEQPLELARAYWDLAGIYERQNRTEHTELYSRARSLFLETGARVPEK
jgi:tetratricopeptide (TPR) repeat protein